MEHLACTALRELRELRVWETDAGDAGLIALAPALPFAPRLELLSAGKNHFGDGGVAALAAALPRLPGLQRLDASISANNAALGGEGVAALAVALADAEASALREINLSGTAAGAAHMMAAPIGADAIQLPGFSAEAGAARVLKV
jgi:hypothetical protein